MNRMISVLAFVVGVSTSAPAFDPIAPDGPEGFKAVVEPFLKKHCYDCHGDDSVEGDLNLTALPLQTTYSAHLRAGGRGQPGRTSKQCSKKKC